MTAPTVMGLDLSLTSTGIACLGGLFPNEIDEANLGRVRSTGKKDDDLAKRAVRLTAIFGELMTHVVDCAPHLVVIESPSYASRHGSPHDRSGLWWLVVQALAEMSIPVATVSPQGRAKYGTGRGNAKKPEVYAAVKADYPDVAFTCDDEADALLLALMGMRHLGYAVDPERTAKQLEAMDGAAWPT